MTTLQHIEAGMAALGKETPDCVLALIHLGQARIAELSDLEAQAKTDAELSKALVRISEFNRMNHQRTEHAAANSGPYDASKS